MTSLFQAFCKEKFLFKQVFVKGLFYFCNESSGLHWFSRYIGFLVYWYFCSNKFLLKVFFIFVMKVLVYIDFPGILIWAFWCLLLWKVQITMSIDYKDYKFFFLRRYNKIAVHIVLPKNNSVKKNSWTNHLDWIFWWFLATSTE